MAYIDKIEDYVNWMLGNREVSDIEQDYVMGLFNLSLRFTPVDISDLTNYHNSIPT